MVDYGSNYAGEASRGAVWTLIMVTGQFAQLLVIALALLNESADSAVCISLSLFTDQRIGNLNLLQKINSQTSVN